MTTEDTTPKKGRENTRGRETPRQDTARQIVRELLEANKPISPHGLQDEYGISHWTFDAAIAAEIARRDALIEASVNATPLSMTAQQKLDAVIRQRSRALDLAFEKRVLDEVNRRVNATILPYYKREQAQAKAVMNNRKGIMDKVTFDSIRRCLHPDSRKAVSDAKLAEAFDAFQALEKLLLNEEDSPTVFQDLPDNAAGWNAMRRRPARRHSHLTPRG